MFLHTVMGKDIPTSLCRTLLKEKWRVAVHVRRGHGGLRLQTPRWNPLGDTDDVRDLQTRLFLPPSSSV